MTATVLPSRPTVARACWDGASPPRQLAHIERIEILRGPHGTLFGRDTRAGAINIVTKRPDPRNELSDSATLTLGNFETYSARASVDAPLSESIAVSLAGFVREQGEGYSDDVVSGRDVTKSDFQGLAASLRARPNDSLVIDASIFASRNDGDRPHGQPIVVGTGANALARNDQVARGRAVRAGQALEAFSEGDTLGGDLSIEYDFGTRDPGADATAIANVLGEEENDTFELGAKAGLFGDLRLDIAAFLLETTNLAVGQILPNGFVQQSNVGEVRIHGLEVEATWAPTERFIGRLAFAVQDAERQDVGNQPPTGILLGETVAGVSNHVVTIGADYTLPIGA